jgi:uncharacterized membrane protein
MRKLLFTLIMLFPFFLFSQECVKVDTVFVTAKLRELGSRDIRFGIKQIVEEELSQKFCLSDNGEPIKVEVFYFGLPKTTIRVVGVEKTNTITQVGIRLHYKGNKYEGIGESDTEIRAIMIEVQEGSVPFEKMTVSSALKKAIHEAAIKLP